MKVTDLIHDIFFFSILNKSIDSSSILFIRLKQIIRVIPIYFELNFLFHIFSINNPH